MRRSRSAATRATASRTTGWCSREGRAASRRPSTAGTRIARRTSWPRRQVRRRPPRGFQAHSERSSDRVMASRRRKPPRPLSVDALVDGQPCEQDHRHGVPGKLLWPVSRAGSPRRSPRWPGCSTPARADLLPEKRDIGPSQVALLVLADQRVEEVVERGLAAVEALPHVPAVESLDSPLTHAFSAFPAIKRRRAAFGFGG